MPSTYHDDETPLRLLIVEDDDILRRSCVRVLREWECDIIEADSLEAARHTLHTVPDLVILDVCLPDGSGVDFASELVALAPIPQIIAVSGTATASEAFKLKELGVRGYLPKPFALEELVATIDGILQAPPELAPHLTPYLGRTSFRKVQAEVRKTLLQQAMTLSDGNRTHAARLLDVSRQAVQQMIKEFDLDEHEDHPSMN